MAIHLLLAVKKIPYLPQPEARVEDALVVMVLGSAIFGVVISGCSVIFSQYLNSETENKIAELSRFMHHRAVPRELQTRVRDNLRQHLVYSEASGMLSGRSK